MKSMRFLAILVLLSALASGPTVASADDYDESSFQVAQNNGGKTLAQAIEQVRRQTGGQILDAKTVVKGGREVHQIKVLTRDGKVKTHQVQGRRRGG